MGQEPSVLEWSLKKYCRICSPCTRQVVSARVSARRHFARQKWVLEAPTVSRCGRLWPLLIERSRMTQMVDCWQCRIAIQGHDCSLGYFSEGVRHGVLKLLWQEQWQTIGNCASAFRQMSQSLTLPQLNYDMRFFVWPETASSQP